MTTFPKKGEDRHIQGAEPSVLIVLLLSNFNSVATGPICCVMVTIIALSNQFSYGSILVIDYNRKAGAAMVVTKEQKELLQY